MKIRKRLLASVAWLILITMPAGHFTALANDDPDLAAVNADADALSWEAIKGGNTDSNNVTGPLSLIFSGANESTITWSWVGLTPPANTSVNSGGAVTRPAFADGDASGIIRAEVQKGEAKAYKDIPLTVKAIEPTNAEAVERAGNALTWDTIKGANTAENNVTSNLTLPASGAEGTAISWASSSPGVISVAGAVTRPSGLGNIGVTLTATISKSGVSADKEFDLTVTEQTYIPVTGITGVPAAATVGAPLALTGTVAPANATNRTILWSVQNAGTTGATISGSTLNTTAAGTVTVRATITDGLAAGSNFTRDFTITVSTAQADINTVRNWLTWNVIRSGNGEQSGVTNASGGNTASRRYEVTSSLTLPASGSISRVSIAWSSSNTTALTNTGGVIGNSSVVQGVTLTATLTIAGVPAAQITNNTVVFYLNIMPDQVVVDAIRNWMTWEAIRGGNAQQGGVTGASGGNTSSRRYEVTANLNLRLSLPAYLDTSGNGYSSSGSNRYSTDGYSVQWGIANGTSSATINTNTGVVTFPSSGSRDVTLTGEIRRNNASLSGGNRLKDFYLTILPASADQIAVNEAMNWLIWNEIRRHNDTNTSTASNVTYTVKSHLTLPTSYLYKSISNANDDRTVTVTWTTSNSNYVTASGDVTTSGANRDVTLTAVFTCGLITSASTTNNPNAKTFSLRVVQPTDNESVRMAKDALIWDVIKNRNESMGAVSSNLSLPTTGENGTTVTWASSNTSVISNTGTVTPLATGTVLVTLTATVRKGSVSDAKSFSLTTGDERFALEQTVNGMTARMTAGGFNVLTANGTRGFDVEGNLGTVRFDAAAAKAIGSFAFGEITVSMNRVSDATLPNRPVYDLTVRVGASILTSFSGGAATVEIGYNLAAGEDPNAIFVSYLDGAGGMRAARSFYTDASGRGKVVFTTGHFSKFAINYSDPTNSFTDAAAINAAWNGTAKQHVTFVTSRGLYNGNTLSDGSRSFGPNDSMTRAQFVAVLRNYHSGGVSSHTANSFADGNGDWYAGVIGWGEEMGLFGTYSDTNFYPNAPVTRADMAYWLYNYASRNGVRLDSVRTLSFTDIDGLASGTRTAVQTLANAGVISGELVGFDRVYRPGSTSTRAEVAAIIAQFVKAFSL